MAQLPAPWIEHRVIAEQIGEAVSDAMTTRIGANVDLSIAGTCEPEQMLVGRALPLRATIVRFRRPLRDLCIFISSLSDDALLPCIEVAAAAIIDSLDVSTIGDSRGATGTWEIEPSVEYETVDVAIDECNALYLEAMFTLDMPMGDVNLVLGTGLLESAACVLNGVRDPFAEEPPLDALSDDEAAHEALAERHLIVDPVTGKMIDPDIDALRVDAAVSDASAESPMIGIDALDALLADQQFADQAASGRAAGSTPAHAAFGSVVDANAAAAASATDPSIEDNPTTRWTHLLSGVEVELSAELGRTDMLLGDITSLVSESVLTLEQGIDEPVGVFVNGALYATARLVVVDGEYGIEILEVLEQASAALTSAFAA